MSRQPSIEKVARSQLEVVASGLKEVGAVGVCGSFLFLLIGWLVGFGWLVFYLVCQEKSQENLYAWEKCQQQSGLNISPVLQSFGPFYTV